MTALVTVVAYFVIPTQNFLRGAEIKMRNGARKK
jgi:hypothetical protein